MTKYYVEFEIKDSGEIFSMQSRWFDTKAEAKDWFMQGFDLVRASEISVYLMRAEFDQDSVFSDIMFEEILVD